MGVFDDKKFEQLDWMTQITETIDSPLNQLLAELPQEVEINSSNILEFVGRSHDMSISRDSVLRKFIKKLNTYSLSWEEERLLFGCFKFEISEGAEFCLETGAMTGTITLRKIVQTFEDESLQKHLGSKGCKVVGQVRCHETSLPRMNEVLELLGNCNEYIKNRSSRKKIIVIRRRLSEIMTKNEWRIRDTELADKVGMWMAEYIRSGNLAAFTNFCKLKVMTHSNMPIYSIEEEK